MHLMKGGSLTKIAMPVGLSQPNTFLQHIACEYACAPLYLGAAAAAGADGDFVERMIQVAAYVVSGLYRCVCFSGIWISCFLIAGVRPLICIIYSYDRLYELPCPFTNVV